MVGFRAWESLRRSVLRGGGVCVVAVAVVGGCAGQSTSNQNSADLCPNVCAKGKKCPMPPTVPPIGSCDDECLGEDYVATTSNCEASYQKSLDCLSKLADICTGLTACKAEIAAAQQCEHNYCAAHQGDPACVNVQ